MGVCKIWFILAAALLGTLMTAQGQEIAIAFKHVNEYTHIWDDRGSGADRDVSIWKPVDIESGFFALGDTASASHSKPDAHSMTVSAVVAGALAQPVGFTEVWNDAGSGANADVRIMRMDPPSGYTCLGHVAVQGHGSSPNANQYRCVKSEYVVNSGVYDLIWNDHGSGADRDVSLWANTNIDSDVGVDSNTFTPFTTYGHTRQGSPNLLKAEVAKPRSLIPRTTIDKLAIIVYQVTDTDKIWTDSGSGADRDFSSWRAMEMKGYFSLGDIGVGNSHTKPRFSNLVKAIKSDALVAPISFRQRWNDAGSGADDDVAFYEPICPVGYRALGYVTKRSHSPPPSTDDIRCVKAEYTTEGRWEFVWDDAGSGARTDVTVWKAIATQSGQGVEAMSAVPCHCDMNRRAYILNRDFIQYIVSRPVSRYILNDITYMVDDRQILSQEPEVLKRTTLINRGTTSQDITRVVGYTYAETHTWSASAGLEIGISTTVEASAPGGLAKTSTEYSFKTTFSFTTGGTTSETTSDTIRVGLSVLPLSAKSAIVTSNRYTIDVPFEATVTPVFTDEKQGAPYRFTGLYQGVRISDIRVVYGPDTPIPEVSSSDEIPAPVHAEVPAPVDAVPAPVHVEAAGPGAEVPDPRPTKGDCGLTQLKQCFCVDAAVTIGGVDEDCPWDEAPQDHSKCFCVNVNICTRSFVPPQPPRI